MKIRYFSMGISLYLIYWYTTVAHLQHLNIPFHGYKPKKLVQQTWNCKINGTCLLIKKEIAKHDHFEKPTNAFTKRPGYKIKRVHLEYFYTNIFRKTCTYLYAISFWEKVLFTEKSTLQNNMLNMNFFCKHSVEPHPYLSLVFRNVYEHGDCVNGSCQDVTVGTSWLIGLK